MKYKKVVAKEINVIYIKILKKIKFNINKKKIKNKNLKIFFIKNT